MSVLVYQQARSATGLTKHGMRGVLMQRSSIQGSGLAHPTDGNCQPDELCVRVAAAAVALCDRTSAMSRPDPREWVRLVALALTYVVTIALEVSSLRRLMAPHDMECAA